MNKNKALLRFDGFVGNIIQGLKLRNIDFQYIDEQGKSLTVFEDSVIVRISTCFNSSSSETVSEYDFVEACISTAHEMHHAAVLSQSRSLRRDIIDLSESYISRFNNNVTYAREYNKFSYEIAAERYALKTTYDYLNNKFPMLDTDAIMIDYVNAKAVNCTTEYPYPIQSIRRFTDMQKVFELFDKAYEKSFVTKKSFQRAGDYVSSVLDKNTDLKQGFEQAENGREQTKFVVAINASNDSDLFKTFTSLKPKDYDIKQIYNARNRRFAESADEILNSLSSNCIDLQDEIFK